MSQAATEMAKTPALLGPHDRQNPSTAVLSHQPASSHAGKPHSETLEFPDETLAAERSQRPSSALHTACTSAPEMGAARADPIRLRALDSCRYYDRGWM